MIIFADTETTGLHTWEGARIFLYCLAIENGPVELWYKSPETTAKFKALAEDPANQLVWHNAVFDLQMLAAEGIYPANPPHDTMIQAHLLHPLWKKINLETVARYVNKDEGPSQWKDRVTRWLLRNGFNKGEIWNLPKEELIPYATDDIVATRLLHWHMHHDIEKRGLKDCYETECALAVELAAMKIRGVLIDIEHCKKIAQEIHDINTSLLTKMFQTAGYVFNPASGPQIGEVIKKLVPEKNIPKKKTAKGAQCWDRELLVRIKHSFVTDLLKFRALDKLRNTYYEGIPKTCVDNISHTSLNALFTRTGRFSSSRPNLQNIPAAKRWNSAERGFEYMSVMDVKKVFPVREEYANWYFDYSQIELRVLAAYTRDKRMTEAYIKGDDLHTLTARAALNIHKRPLTEAERFVGKQLNFAIVYGMGPKALGELLKVSYGKARQFLLNFHAAFPGVRLLSRMLERQLGMRGYIKDLFGRIYKLSDRERYKATNYLVQGTAAGIMKACMIKVADVVKETGAHMLLCIHDELQVEIPLGSLELKTAKHIKDAMEDFHQFKVPILVEVKRSMTNWSEGAEVKL